ncbi:hypothetical protein CQA01_15170 [Cyclobacterium qasimii]|uniref:Uncharacterized protein n=1 Tax=Cyclobacterium qasimii TaxID=1350429 RepID=A0A512C9U7_9BACT|nr:hypothetical protein CQA01_15170 [Cyclobacterium qasimii]
MAFINGLKPIPIEQISLINLTVLLNEFENFQLCRSKLHYVKLEPEGRIEVRLKATDIIRLLNYINAYDKTGISVNFSLKTHFKGCEGFFNN